MPNCPDCHATLIKATTESGVPILVDLVPHRYRCRKRQRNGTSKPNIEFSMDISKDEQASLKAAIERAEKEKG